MTPHPETPFAIRLTSPTLSRTLVVGAGLGLLWVGYFLRPWIPHESAALTLNGFDLAEWLAFLPAVQSGQLPIGRVQQTVPLALMVLMTAAHGWRLIGAARWGLLGLAGLGCVALLPGYPFILFWRSDAVVQQQLGLLAVTGVLAGLAVFLPRLDWRIFGGLVSGLGVAALVVASFNLFTLLPTVSAYYGYAVPAGDGFWWFAAGCLLSGLAGWLRP